MTFFDYGEVIDKDSEFVLFGIPWDYLTSIDIANSAIAPEKIREVTNYLALSTELGIDVLSFKVVDLGDIEIIPTNVETNLNKIRAFVQDIYRQKKDIIPIMIGGDHFCSFPVIKEVGNNCDSIQEFGVLIFDAHLDFYQEWDKGVYSHATVSHRIFDLEFINNKNLMIVGTRDIDTPELQLAAQEKITFLSAHELQEQGLEQYINKIIDFFQTSNIKKLYVSLDIDAFDPSNAPATGYAIPGGFTYREMWVMLKKIAENFEVIGFDLVETSPNLDFPNRITCNLAAKTVIEFISFIKNNKK